MVGIIQDEETQPIENMAPSPESDCKPINQNVFLDLDLWSQTLTGSTQIDIAPASTELKTVKLNCRQMKITKVTVAQKAVSSMTYTDPYELAILPWEANVHQYHMLEDRLHDYVKLSPESELIIPLPKSVRILPSDTTAPNSSDAIQNSKVSSDYNPYRTISIYIEFIVDHFRDGLHFVGCDETDLRFPHVYTSKLSPRSTCCVFPCFDTFDKRCTWELSFRTARTIGDAISAAQPSPKSNGVVNLEPRSGTVFELSEQDRAIDLKVVCSGHLTDEIVDSNDPTKKTTSFTVDENVAAHHVGFAIGAFQTVDLTKFRESNDEDRLGKSAIPVFAFCLPGRASEAENTCFPIAKAMDFMVTEYSRYVFKNFKTCFVDGMVEDRIDTATLSLVSTRLLFPPEIIDTMDHVTRELIYGLAGQWFGIHLGPREPTDTWATVGIAYFMVDSFLTKLSGHNENRLNQCKDAETVVEMDNGRPSIAESGRYLATDPSHMDLIKAKAPLVLFILARRLGKAGGTMGVSRIINKVLLARDSGSMLDGALSTAEFIKICERISHGKLDVFFKQWVMCAGCPKFRVTQKFNKKKLVVEVSIMQSQSEQMEDGDLRGETFMRNVKEHVNEIYEGDTQPVFTVCKSALSSNFTDKAGTYDHSHP